MRKYIGTSTNSKKMKNTSASSARNTPIIADSSNSIQTMNDFGLATFADARSAIGNSNALEGDHEQADAVDAERPAHAERADPRVVLDELVAGLQRAGVELREQEDRHPERGHARDVADGPRELGPAARA